MGGNSKTTTRNTVYGDTTTTNPYAYTKTNNSGTVAGFQNGTALNSIYNFVNSSIDSLLNEYLQPNIDSTTSKAKIDTFTNSLNSSTRNNLENSIINPLSSRNMLRSSQATDLYKNLYNKNSDAVANYINDLLSSSQDNTAKVLTNLLSYYMQGANYLANMQNQSLRTSAGNATTTNTVDSGSLDDFTQKLASMAFAKALEKI